MLYALVQVRSSASAALNLRDYQAFSRVFTGSTGTFSDPTRLTRWTRGFLCAHVAIVVIRLSIRALERMGGGTVELSPVVWGLWRRRQPALPPPPSALPPPPSGPRHLAGGSAPVAEE